jgi:hypothetical protein
VQEVQPGDHVSTGAAGADAAHGILEDPNGVVRIYSCGTLIASGYDHKKTYISGIYSPDDTEHHIEWDRWSFPELRWSHKAALMFLQGSSMQQLVMPYLLLRAHPMPPYDPRPGAHQVVLAELHVAPDPPLDHHLMFSLLAPDALRLDFSGA